jgi:hypothetical protein
MKGIWKMLTGQGEAEYRAQHQAFRDALPREFPFVIGEGDHAVVRYGRGSQDLRPASHEDLAQLPSHPAYAGPLVNTSDAFNYRRATACHGPLPTTNAEVTKQPNTEQAEMRGWLNEYGIPLPDGES